MKRRFNPPIVVLISAVVLDRHRDLLPATALPWLLLLSKLLGVVGLLWLAVRLLDWWGEEAPVWHPCHMGQLVRLTYREAKVRLRLIELFDGDARMARRQVRIIKARYPSQPEQWCWERAIADLENRLAS